MKLGKSNIERAPLGISYNFNNKASREMMRRGGMNNLRGGNMGYNTPMGNMPRGGGNQMAGFNG
jgi:hypothetical protein